MPPDLFIGLDIGTSGARAVAMSEDGAVEAAARAPLNAYSANRRDPAGWLAAGTAALQAVAAAIDRPRVRAICVDGTSGTMIPITAAGQALAEGRMYDDPCPDVEFLARIAAHAPPDSAAHGATSGLAKVLMLQNTAHVSQVVHQADWIAGQLCGVYSSDDNNALKTGFDPVAGRWPDWMDDCGVARHVLPAVHRPGTVLGPVLPWVCAECDLPAAVRIVAGTTDGCAAFLATGASAPGDGVTSLGTTLVLKLLCDKPIFAPESGIYSHRVMGMWLAGGASNTGGGVLLDHFTAAEIDALGTRIDPDIPLDLGYYPLRQPGERFPIADPLLEPLIAPRPDDPAEFLQALLEGISRIEALGYSKLRDLGGPALRSVRTVGGGAGNAAWSRIRARHLGVDLPAPRNVEAAYGAAVLARYGLA